MDRPLVFFPAMRPGSCDLGRYDVAMMEVHGHCPYIAVNRTIPIGSPCPCGKCGKRLAGWVVDKTLGHERWLLCLTFKASIELN